MPVQTITKATATTTITTTTLLASRIIEAAVQEMICSRTLANCTSGKLIHDQRLELKKQRLVCSKINTLVKDALRGQFGGSIGQVALARYLLVRVKRKLADSMMFRFDVLLVVALHLCESNRRANSGHQPGHYIEQLFGHRRSIVSKKRRPPPPPLTS